jgi:hypothetical protein
VEPVQDGDNLKRVRLWPVHNGVVGIAGQCPETKRTGCEVGAGMVAQGSFGNSQTPLGSRSPMVLLLDVV